MKAQYKHTRFLAAVMFVDIIGYTAIMQKNEQEAFRMRKLLRKVLDRQIQAHEGRLIQYYGDGALSLFTSALESVKSALKIQVELKKLVVPVRIGLHQGEVVYTGDGIYGNAVNIASRIETLAHAGGILISGKIYEEIRNQQGMRMQKAGSFELKNIEDPLKLYSVTDVNGVSQREKTKVRWRQLHSLQVRTALVRPYLSNTNPGLLN